MASIAMPYDKWLDFQVINLVFTEMYTNENAELQFLFTAAWNKLKEMKNLNVLKIFSFIYQSTVYNIYSNIVDDELFLELIFSLEILVKTMSDFYGIEMKMSS